MRFCGVLSAILLIGIILNPQSAPITSQIAYQGILTDNAGNPLADSSYNIEFSLYTDSAGGTPVWAETKTVTTRGGMFSHMLGSVISLEGLKFDKQYWLSVKKDGNQIGQRIRLGEAPYAVRAMVADSAARIDGRNITSKSIDSTKIADGSIGTNQISVIDGNKIAADFGNQTIKGRIGVIDSLSTGAIVNNRSVSSLEFIENGLSLSKKYIKSTYDATFTGTLYEVGGQYIRLATVSFPTPGHWYTATILATNSFFGIQHCTSAIISLSNE